MCNRSFIVWLAARLLVASQGSSKSKGPSSDRVPLPHLAPASIGAYLSVRSHQVRELAGLAGGGDLAFFLARARGSGASFSAFCASVHRTLLVAMSQ